MDILDELKIKTANCTIPGWAARAAREIETTRQRRNDLLAALKAIRAGAEQLANGDMTKMPAGTALADAAIAEAEGR